MASFTFVQDYLRHRLTANNRHGIHSPFVYQLIDTVIYNYHNQKAYHEIAIELSGQNIATERKLPVKVLKLIYRLTKHFNPSSIVEVGEGGRTSHYLQKAVPLAKIDNVNDAELKGGLTTCADMVIFNNDVLNLQVFETLLTAVYPDTIMIFTGVHNNTDAKRVWDQVKAHPRVTLTIDLFWIGLVFFKLGRAEKEHFKIKY
ncbi:hypothetical protein [Mucilaginibacter dorajii]|uniref:SAM-dependent methyltransferase n=1 Tax=Mucilaginibacter dorajii TaxID=692994 RepID=A0ABP7PD72_9SPHI|nr:hypothetical protein [Mucilaginibacter dorajii]MCS3734702.1 hypothetical protein [Mucilaginibacter dorajii]